MTTCTHCWRPATHGDHCGPCAVAAATEALGTNEGHTYESQPHMVDGVVTHYEVYEQRQDRRRFFCTLAEWPNSAAARRIGAVVSPNGPQRTEGA